MIFVPVGNNVPMADVQGWASAPQLVIKAGNFNDLSTTVVREIQKAACPTTTTTTTVKMCKGKGDMVVVVDGSGSVGQQGWDLSKQATVALFDLVNADTRMATVVFSGSAELLTGLTQNKAKLTTDMQAKAFPRSSTNTAAGLKTARLELESNGLANTEKVIIVITDGRPNPPKSLVDDEVQKCKNNGYKMIFVPVGSNVPMADVQRWASSPQLVVQASNFNSLATTVVAEIQKAACPPVIDMMLPRGRPVLGRTLQQITTTNRWDWSWSMIPRGTVSNWGSLLHVTTGGNCCNNGDRVPACWFHGGKLSLHCAFGNPGVGNDLINCDFGATFGVQYDVKLSVDMRQASISVNGAVQCSKTLSAAPTVGLKATVYACDPWYMAADAEMWDLKYAPN